MKSCSKIDDLIHQATEGFGKNDKRPKHVYFYKGTAFPVISPTPFEETEAMTNDIIVETLRHGQSLTEQTNYYIKKLDEIRKVIVENSDLPDLPENNIDKVLERHFKTPFETLMMTWIWYVCALKRLKKKIKGEGINGCLVIYPDKNIQIC